MRKVWLILVLVIVLGSCSAPEVEQFIVGEKSFVVLNKVKLIERNQDGDSKAVFGVVSDLHINDDDSLARKIRLEFLKNRVEYIFILGDSNLNEGIRGKGPEKTANEEELFRVFKILAQNDVPTFVIPGNHEGATDYANALARVQQEYNTLFDMTQYRILHLDDVAVVAVPGYHDIGFLPDDGYLYGENDLSFIPEVADPLPHPILMSHGPPKTNVKNGIDYVPGVGNVGDGQLNTILEKGEIQFSLSGHIHEGGPQIMNSKGEQLDYDTPHSHAWVNVGAGSDGHAAVITMENGRMSMEKITVE